MAANPIFALIFRVEIALLLLFAACLVVVPSLVLATVAHVTPRSHASKSLNYV